MKNLSRPAGASARLPVALGLAVAASLAHAAPADEARTLDTLVVTAAAPSSPLHWVTDPRLPRQPVPASDGADYLKTVPGFSAIRNGGTNGDPVLRGMFGSRLNILSNDGNLIGACPSRMDNPLSYIAPESFDRLTIIKGPQSVRWGAGASAGTIRFERDTPRFEAPGLRADASALVGSRNRNDQVVDLTVGNPSGYVRASGNRSEADDYKDGHGAVVPSKWRKWNGDVALGWTPDADTLLEVSAGAGDAIARYAGRGMDGAAFERTTFGARFEKRNLPGAWDTLQANVYYNEADHVMDNYTLRTPNPHSSMPMPMASNVDRRTQGGRISSEWRWQDVQLVAGVDAEDSRHRGRVGMGRNTYQNAAWSRDADFERQGVFTELTLGADTARRWISGLRIDRARVRDTRAQISGMMMDMPNPTAGRQRRQWLGSGFLRYEQDLAQGLTAYAGLGHSERMPDYWELFSPDAGPAGSVNAFAGIQPERTTQLDVGVQYNGPRVQAWVSAYAGQIQDYILFNYHSGGMMGSSSQADNIDARIAGAEAGLKLQLDEQWSLGSTLAYAWGENRDAHRPLPQMPPLEARLSADWQGQRWSAGALLRAVTAQHRVAAGQGNVVAQDLGPSAGFATFALNAAYRFSTQLQLSAGVDNLFDRAYSEHLNLAGSADFGFPADPVRINEPGRSLWMKVNYRY
ncbi:TonB-dependent copper receptor [Stenotrophomonas sp. S48]|uniref:TonB-dependent copper receptor n=1 Tax=unclassified Stenotrophomonas TaxID=196198 RepID=UPI0018FF84A6|nr:MULTISPECIES: TonB-dependent copper receptor [unclassified Stenotrophomonas]MBK0027412.1 TonB-dependent copper receptor [Stenotrophomonas sp. S48]MBK0050313.1 TonB-dependent copper receptor [Stenotrophomonas sp. S49]